MLTPQEIKNRLTRIQNLIDVISTAQTHKIDRRTQEMLADLLMYTWELCRDVNPEILIRAGSGMRPPSRTNVIPAVQGHPGLNRGR